MTRLTTLLTSATSDKLLTKKEAKAIIAEAKADGTVTQEECDEVKQTLKGVKPSCESVRTSMVQTFGDVFKPGDPTPPFRNLPDPGLAHTDGQVVYQRRTGALFVNAATADDPKQGDLGDCRVIAFLSAFAAAKPGELEKRVRDNGDGTCTVTFYQGKYEQDENGQVVWKAKPYDVEVDYELPVGMDDHLAYASSTSKDELWISVIEKAYALTVEHRGGYAFLDQCQGGDPFRLFDGGMYVPATSVSGPDKDVQAIVRANVDNHVPMTASSYASTERNFNGTGLVANHMYSLLGFKKVGSRCYVELRNPWAKTEPGNDGKDDGRFWLEWSKFKKFFRQVHQ